MTIIALGSAGTGGFAVVLAGALWPHRSRHGGLSLVALAGAVALWSFSYAAALLVFDPVTRLLLELLVWVCVTLVTALFFVFGLAYAGRQRLLRSRWTAAALALFVVALIPVVTNPLHGVAWSGFVVDPVFGAATVSYTPRVGLFFYVGWGYILMVVGLFSIVETFLSYGSLFRTQTLALVGSTLPPSVAQTVWLLDIGPYPQLNPVPFVFPLSIALLGYATYRRDLFDLAPAARRVGERTAINDIGTAVVIVSEGGRIVNLNGAAADVLGVDAGVLGDDISAHFPGFDTGLDREPYATTVDGGRRTYNVTTSEVTDAGRTVVGYTVVFEDVTVERRQRQRLSVLNRALRHNIRNTLNTIQGGIHLVEESVDDPEDAARLRRVRERTWTLLDMAEKAKESEQLLSAAAAEREQVAVAPVLQTVSADLEAMEGTVDVDVPQNVTVRGDERVLGGVFRNLVENGLEHNDADEPRVVVRYAASDGRAVFIVADNGTGIPDYEVAALDQSAETPLTHSTGMGLWVTVWLVEELGGEVRFDTTNGGTRVVVDLPAATPSGGDPAPATE